MARRSNPALSTAKQEPSNERIFTAQFRIAQPASDYCIMAAIPFMPLYVADYMSDAAHLSTLEHGAYLLLIMTYWQRGEPLPNDDKKLARICRLGPREWQRVRDILSEFFQVDCSTWSHKRVEQELANVRDKSLKNRKAGLARAKQMHSERSANAKPSDTDTDTYTHTEVIEAKASNARAKPIDFPCPDGVDQIDWNALKANRKAKRAALSEGAYRQIIKKLDGWKQAGWPPGPIVAYAAERGWTTVFETDEMKVTANGNGNRKVNGKSIDGRSSLARAIDEGLDWLDGTQAGIS